MEIKLKGEMTLADIRQALFEQFARSRTIMPSTIPAAPLSISTPQTLWAMT
jgi:hypothetical protein